MSEELPQQYFNYHKKPSYFGDYLKIFNADRARESVLDVGCGLGWLADHFDNYTGLEYSKKIVEKAKQKNRNVIWGDAEKIFPFENEQFSMVVLMDILEHLNNPSGAVRESLRVLKKRGQVFAFAPDNQKWVWDDYSHKRPFSKKSFKRLFEDSGFKVSKISYEPVMSGVDKFCKFFKINRRPNILWLLAKTPFFKRNVYIVAKKPEA